MGLKICREVNRCSGSDFDQLGCRADSLNPEPRNRPGKNDFFILPKFQKVILIRWARCATSVLVSHNHFGLRFKPGRRIGKL